VKIVPFSRSDCSKCTPFYVTCQKFQKSALFKNAFEKSTHFKQFSSSLLYVKTPPFTRFCCRTCVPTFRPSDPPVLPPCKDYQPPIPTPKSASSVSTVVCSLAPLSHASLSQCMHNFRFLADFN
jgi:hypothetical protein